ncbi:hypothetical protein GWO25_02010, partial [Candidatus Saccharibacteria bacterium]|nr:hypothetical protein [Candidatus Saccharibacteria bacterium]
QAKGNETNLLILHLAATAFYRLGNEKKAWKLWQQAVKISPSFELAQESLAEQSLPIGERDVPWYWSFGYWFPQDFGQFFVKHLGSDFRR